jgi:hypothetical protein
MPYPRRRRGESAIQSIALTSRVPMLRKLRLAGTGIIQPGSMTQDGSRPRDSGVV